MPTKLTWSLGFCLAIILAFAGVVSSTANADSSTPGDGYTAPAPSKLDPAETDQDQYCIADMTFIHPDYGFGEYWVDGVPLDEGCHSTKGASSITITTDFNSGTWTFDYTDDQSATEAENKYKVVVGETCHTSSSLEKYRVVTAYFTNVADGTGRYVHSIYPYTVSTTGADAYDTEVAMDVADGETAAMRIMVFAGRLPGLRPGKYKVQFWRDDNAYAGYMEGYVVMRMTIVVPQCGKASTGSQASGSLKRVSCKAVRVTADARGFSAAPRVNYRVIRKPSGKSARPSTFVVKAGQKHSFRLRHMGQVKTRVVLRVRRPNGHWVRLDSVRMPRCH